MNLLDGLRGRNRTTKCAHWVAFAIRSQESRCQVADAGTGGSNCDASPTRQPSDAACNESCVLLVAADDGLNGGRNKGVKHLVDLRAGDSKHILNALPFKRFDHDLGAGFRWLCSHLVGCSTSKSSSTESRERSAARNCSVSGRETCISVMAQPSISTSEARQSRTCPPCCRSSDRK